MLNKYNFPLFHWHLEISSKCALACSRCPRTGDENKHKFNVTEQNLEFIQKVFTPQFIQENMSALLLCGGQGDPIYNSQLIEIIHYFKSSKPSLRISLVTNGSYKSSDWWKNLASELNEYDDITFSIDGWDQESNSKYRANCDFESIMLGISEMVHSKVFVRWSTILFKFNQSKIEDIKELARSLGVNAFDLVYSKKFDGKWSDNNGTDPLKPDPEYVSTHRTYTRTANIINPKYRANSGFIQDVQNKHAEVSQINWGSVFPVCLTGEKGVYVDASGVFHPCSWISHPHDMILRPGQINFFLDHKDKLNLNVRSLEEVLNDNIWSDFLSSWTDPDKNYYECQSKCPSLLREQKPFHALVRK